MIKTSKYTKSSDDYFVSIGFAEKALKGDFDHENFPSKLCGLPIWLIPPEIDNSFFTCSSCNKNLSFLMQIYCPLENNKNCYHRVLYIFFCKICWKTSDAVKVLRIQLPKISEYYNDESVINKNNLTNNEKVISINKAITPLYPEYLIDSVEERESACKLYINFYDNIDEKSLKSRSIEDLLEIEDETMTKVDKIEADKMIENYCKENNIEIENANSLEDEIETEFIDKVDKNIFNRDKSEDVFYELYSKVVSYDPKQVMRYCRDGIFPLWYCSKGMLTTKNTKCKNCGGELIFEFQVRKFLFTNCK